MKDMCPVCDRAMPKKHMDAAQDKKMMKKEMPKMIKGMMKKKMMKRGK
jgi:hypothetical protein